MFFQHDKVIDEIKSCSNESQAIYSVLKFKFRTFCCIDQSDITDAIAAGYCFSACFLAEPLLKELLLF